MALSANEPSEEVLPAADSRSPFFTLARAAGFSNSHRSAFGIVLVTGFVRTVGFMTGDSLWGRQTGCKTHTRAEMSLPSSLSVWWSYEHKTDVFEGIKSATARMDLAEITRLSKMAQRVQAIEAQAGALNQELQQIENSLGIGRGSDD